MNHHGGLSWIRKWTENGSLLHHHHNNNRKTDILKSFLVFVFKGLERGCQGITKWTHRLHGNKQEFILNYHQ